MIVTSTATTPRRQPLQTRSRATVDVILEAAAQVLIKGGSAAFNTNDVALKGGVSIGSVYQYFPDKESLLAELKRRNTQAMATRVIDIFCDDKDRPMVETLRAAIRALIAHHLRVPELHRLLEEEVIVLPEIGFPELLKLDGVRAIRIFLEKHRHELVVADLDLATFILARTFRHVMTAALRIYPEKLASGAIEDELTGFSIRYLTGSNHGRGDDV